MSLKECYDKMGADYEDVLSRLRSEVLVRKFALKFLDDDSYANLKAAMESGNAPEAFRGAHTLKGVAQNLGFGPLYKAAAEVTESLRPSETSSGDMENFWQTRWALGKGLPDGSVHLKRRFSFQR